MLLLLSCPSGELVCYVIKRNKVKYHIRKPHQFGEAFYMSFRAKREILIELKKNANNNKYTTSRQTSTNRKICR